jgi:hypothetical protein
LPNHHSYWVVDVTVESLVTKVHDLTVGSRFPPNAQVIFAKVVFQLLEVGLEGATACGPGNHPRLD